MKLKIYENSKNYTCQVIQLPSKQQVNGLDNLVKVNHQGNDCLIGKDSDPNELYLFFPAECQISHEFLSNNNLYRHSELNKDKTKKGFFEDNQRVKAIKFRGIVSTGFIIPISSLDGSVGKDNQNLLKIGDEFNEIEDIVICKKYIRKFNNSQQAKASKIIDEIVNSKFAPEHFDTEQLMKNIHKLSLSDYVAITYKLHGTSARYFNTLTKRKLNWFERVLKALGIKIQDEVYGYITGSRKVLKSLNFEEFDNKNHYYSEDLWTKVGKQYFEGKLNQGEAVYCEIIGKDYTGADIQSGYSYGLNMPKVYIYRISNINSQGIEIDLSYKQMKERAKQLDIAVCIELYYGKLQDFIIEYQMNKSFEENLIFGESKIRISQDDRDIEPILSDLFYNHLLEKPSILDTSVVEEGFCIRVDKYPKPEIYKIKSKQFLLHEGQLIDKQIDSLE